MRANILFILFALFGFTAGYALHPKKIVAPSRNPAGEEVLGSVNKYDALPCLEEGEYRKIAEIVHLEVPAGIDTCADAAHGKLSKLFSLVQKLRVNIPPTWAPSVQEEIREPIGYIAKMTSRLKFDFTQTTSIAFNRPADNTIYLGGLFFDQSPLDGLSTLVHEARHSSPQDPRHAVCELGDIPKTGGGCDETFSVEAKDAGAYSYESAFYAAFGLYAEGLSKGDREYLRSLSLATIGTRFNHLPPELAQAHDLILTLDRDKNVSLVHPFGGSTPLELPFLAEGEKAERIEFNVKNNGILFFTSAHRLFTWSPRDGFSQMYAKIIPEDYAIFEAARIRVMGEGDYSYYNFLFGNNDLSFIQYDANAKKYALAKYPMLGFFRKSPPPPQLSRFFMALGGRSLFLDKAGLLYVGGVFGNELAFGFHSDLQLPGKTWLAANGGVMFDSLYGLSSEGKLYFGNVSLEPTAEDDIGDFVYHWKDSRFQLPEGKRAKKFQEGLYFRALLDEEGTLHYESFDGKRHSSWQPEKAIEDFVIFRNHSVAADILGTPAAPAPACELTHGIVEPWMGQMMGLDHGKLTRNNGTACISLGEKVYRDLVLVPAAEPQAAASQSSGEPARLKLLDLSGGSEIIRPYER